MSDRTETARRVRRFLTASPAGLGTVGKYRIVREIGRGGMARVYEAEDPQLHRRVALKILDAPDDEPMRVSRFHREAAIAAQLRHPNIVAIYEVGLVRGAGTGATHFIAMDFVEGESLATLLPSRSPSQEDRLRWFEEIARAVAFAHEKGIIHRDLKPGNILIASSGRALLTDFGLARASWFSVEITRSQAILGTPAYMAPEQVLGQARKVGARTDIYSMGVVLYEMLTGKLPFESETPGELYCRILKQEPSPPSRLRSSIPRELEVICLKAMDKDPGRRYGSALELAEDVARFRKGEPIAARPLSPFVYAWRRIVRWRAILIPVAAVLLVGASFAGWIAYGKAERSRKIQEQMMRAAVAEEERRWGDAREAYRSALMLERNHPTALAGMQRAETSLADHERLEREALQETEEARALLEQPTNQPNTRRSNSSLSQAVTFLESAVRKAPHLAVPHLHLGRAYALQDHDDRALRELDEAIRSQSSLSQAYLERGKIRAKRREWKAAFEEFSAALAINPLMAEARTGRIQASEAQGDLRAALADADELVRTHPRSVISFSLSAELHERLGETQKSVEDCTQAIALDPAFPNSYVNRARLRQKEGQIAEALADYQKALSSAPPTWPHRPFIERIVAELKKGKNDVRNAYRFPAMLGPRD